MQNIKKQDIYIHDILSKYADNTQYLAIGYSDNKAKILSHLINSIKQLSKMQVMQLYVDFLDSTNQELIDSYYWGHITTNELMESLFIYKQDIFVIKYLKILFNVAKKHNIRIFAIDKQKSQNKNYLNEIDHYLPHLGISGKAVILLNLQNSSEIINSFKLHLFKEKWFNNYSIPLIA